MFGRAHSVRLDATWQVPTLALVFGFLGLGNIVTTSWTIPSKIGERQKGLLKLRFVRLDKYFWSHKKSRKGTEEAVRLFEFKSYSFLKRF